MNATDRLMWNHQSIRELELGSIHRFVTESSSYFEGARILDFGCGRQPYREIVERARGVYEPYDRAAFPANLSGEDVGGPLLFGDWRDVVLCTQVAQYWPEPLAELTVIHGLIRPGGVLVMTYPTCWDEVEPGDLWRYTRAGMESLIFQAGFSEILRHERRAEVELGGFRFPLGYGLVARV